MPSDNFFDPVCPGCLVRYGAKVFTRHLNHCHKTRPELWKALEDMTPAQRSKRYDARAAADVQATLERALAANL